MVRPSQENIPLSNVSTSQTSTSKPRSSVNRSTVQSIRKTVTGNIANFFGVGEERNTDRAKWTRRSQHLNRSKLVGGETTLPDTDATDSVFDGFSGGQRLPRPIDPLARGSTMPKRSESRGVSRQMSHLSRISMSSSSRRSMRQAPQRRSTKHSIVNMAFTGVRSFVVPAQRSRKKPQQHSRSFTPHSIAAERLTMAAEAAEAGIDEYIDDVFFDTPVSTTVPVQPPPKTPRHTRRSTAPDDRLTDVIEETTEEDRMLDLQWGVDLRPTTSGWLVNAETADESKGVDEPDAGFPGMKRIANTVLDATFDNSNRRKIGQGIVGKLLQQAYRHSRIDSGIKQQMDQLDDHRPFFTYWVTFVQITIYIISIAVYSLAPIGVETTMKSGEVLKPNLAVELVDYYEQDNLWLGPRQADLIHMGAKYSPCMRKDKNVEKAIAEDRKKEKETACCIRNDGSGCVQTSHEQCSGTLSTFHKWGVDGVRGPNNRKSGSVCGQDPSYCQKPSSTGAFMWKDDITQWPICTESSRVTGGSPHRDRHMLCNLSGRPCCIGIQGECIITTREYCDFRRGYFHEEATLCSQISCMNEICGMIPFLDPDSPDQFYRLWTSLFVHAGLLQLVITVIFQGFIMRDMEKLAGWFRIAIIYIGSGIAGSLASAIFLPYHVEAGPSGSQFGILACLFTEIIQSFQILRHPWQCLLKLGMVLIVLFVFGLLPFVDNYAHLIGFGFGFFLSFALLPFVTFGPFDRQRKLVLIIVGFVLAIGLFVLLIILFYVSPVYNCPHCHYFNCIPFTNDFCRLVEVRIRKHHHE